jgi:hypothetical protein
MSDLIIEEPGKPTFIKDPESGELLVVEHDGQ